MANGLSTGDMSKVAEAMRQNCEATGTLHADITSPYKAALSALFQSQHVLAWKPVGAGAGGCVIVLVQKGSELIVHQACQKESWSQKLWDYDDFGVQYKVEI